MISHDPDRRNANSEMAEITPREAAAQIEAATPSERSGTIAAIGGRIWPPDEEPWLYEEHQYHILLLGISASGDDESSAISKWIENARAVSVTTYANLPR